MRLPNGYGSVIKLSGKRRKPFAVRVTTSFTIGGSEDHPRAVQKYKYLEYFEKRSDAMKYLAEYNSGIKLREHRSLTEIPTFSEVYHMWFAERETGRKGMKIQLRRSYNAAFSKFEDIHSMKICNVRHSDLQAIVNSYSHMSKSSVYNMITVCHEIANYAIKNEYIKTDFSAYLDAEYKENESIHKPFTAEEIARLWDASAQDCAQFALICIYTGMRPSEILQARFAESDLDRKYIITGLKTEAGRDRVIPLHPNIIPVIRGRLMHSKDGHLFRPLSLNAFRRSVWNPFMEDHGMDHLPHDGKHTCATLMESAGISLYRRKLILGHSVTDITEGVYTHVSPDELITEIAKIKPR